jgi:16S rRNA (adenine1518-N6/adenine1519-N6)-dimethyltransferase
VRANKSLGQNFLVDPNLQRKIVDALAVSSEDEVLEIGSGRGALTRHLVGRVRRLVLVEIDGRMVADLRERWGGRSDVHIVHADALSLDLGSLATSVATLKVVGNIPYNITSPLLFHLLQRPRPAEVLVMVQREVANRILADPGSAAYGALAIGVRSVADVEKVLQVPRQAFRPIPGVDSTVIRITPHVPRRLSEVEETDLRVLVRAAFQWRRKQIQKILRDHPDLLVDKDDLGPLGVAVGMELTARPEALSCDVFIALSRALRARP